VSLTLKPSALAAPCLALWPMTLPFLAPRLAFLVILPTLQCFLASSFLAFLTVLPLSLGTTHLTAAGVPPPVVPPVIPPTGGAGAVRGPRNGRAGTYTPFALIALRGLAGALLMAVWAGAAAGIVLTLAWIDAPGWLVALVYVLLGRVGAAALPGLIGTLGAGPAALVAAGGVLYTACAVINPSKRPDPVSAVIGYDEIFHALVIAAAALQYAAIAFFVLPGARQ